VAFGSGRHKYEVVTNWAKLPEGWAFNDAAGVAVDSKDRVYVFSRSEHPLTVFDREGNLLKEWGGGVFSMPHSVRIDEDDMLYLVDVGDSTVRAMTHDGKLVLTLGRKNQPSETGAVGLDFRTIKRTSGPFNGPTDIAFGPAGELLVSDGYGNARVHRFSNDGRLRESRGERGAGPGQYNLPHSICVDKDGRRYVADRENSRVQVFNSDGEYLKEWVDVRRPTCISMDREGTLYVTELGFLAGLFPGMSFPNIRDPLPRLTIRSPGGEILTQWGGRDGCAPGNFFAPHSIAIDSRGDLYVGEVTATTGAPSGCHAIQKFVKKD
jgi:DNA-binding beta-propeller fold protein YncE